MLGRSIHGLRFARTIAVGPASPRTVDQLAGHDCFCNFLVPHVGVTLHFSRGHAWHRAPASDRNFHAQLVAWTDRTPEFRPLDSGEHHYFVAAILDFG